MDEKTYRIKRTYRWLPFVTAIFVTTLLVSNIIAVKIVQISSLSLPAAVILFPIAYIFGDILTEVYGYGRARQVIWTGFFCNLLAVVAIYIGGLLPAASFWSAGSFENPSSAQLAYQAILGFTPRLLLASFIAYLLGEFLNSFVLAKLKSENQGQVPVDPHHFIHLDRSGCGFSNIPDDCVQRNYPAQRPRDFDPIAMVVQGYL